MLIPNLPSRSLRANPPLLRAADSRADTDAGMDCLEGCLLQRFCISIGRTCFTGVGVVRLGLL